jgi:hypothetical protein
VAGIHCLQKVERFGSAHFADDDPLGAHTQAVFHEIAHRYRARPFKIGWARLKPHDVGLLQLEFGGVLAGDDALVCLDIIREAVEQRRLA